VQIKESGKLTLEEWIARLAEQGVEPAQFAERWREMARSIQGGVREPLQMDRREHPASNAPGHRLSSPSLRFAPASRLAMNFNVSGRPPGQAWGRTIKGEAEGLA